MAGRTSVLLLSGALLLGVLCACGKGDPTQQDTAPADDAVSTAMMAEYWSEPVELAAEAEEPEADAEEAIDEYDPTIAVVAMAQPYLFADKTVESPIVTEDENLRVEPTDDPMWYSCTLEDGTTAYAYADHVRREDGERSLFSEYYSEKLKLLQSQLPENKYWNHIGVEGIAYGEESPWIVTDIACDHSTYGEGSCNFYDGSMLDAFPGEGALCQCLGFASFLSDQIFGETALVREIYDYRKLRPGDHIRLAEWTHSMTVVSVSDFGITVAECNENYEDCRISWSRTMSWDEVQYYDWDAEYLTRYPLDEE